MKLNEKTLLQVSGTKSASGDNELIAAPGAGARIVVVKFMVQNISAVATTILLKDGSTEKEGVLAQNQGDGYAARFPIDARWKLAANSPLNMNLSGANTCRYSIGYYIE
jgi:hypothetical protein